MGCQMEGKGNDVIKVNHRPVQVSWNFWEWSNIPPSPVSPRFVIRLNRLKKWEMVPFLITCTFTLLFNYVRSLTSCTALRIFNLNIIDKSILNTSRMVIVLVISFWFTTLFKFLSILTIYGLVEKVSFFSSISLCRQLT